MMKSDGGTEIVELILKNLVQLKHDPHQIIYKLRIQNNGPFKKLHAQAKDIQNTLQFMKEETGPHKSALRFLEILE